MSVVHEATVKSIRVSDETKSILLSGQQGNYRFEFTFYCTTQGILVAFNIGSSRMMVAFKNQSGDYSVVTMRFWLDCRDLPIPSVAYFTDWGSVLAKISDDYRQKLAAYQLDHIIND